MTPSANDGVFEVLLLLALPASGKSEVRRYLDHLDSRQRTGEFRLGAPVELDDYPYVHLMRRIDEELARLRQPPVFFVTRIDAMREPHDWLTLIHLLNEDYAALTEPPPEPDEPARALFARFDAAREQAGVAPVFAGLDPGVVSSLTAALDAEAAGRFADLAAERPVSLEGRTVVIEFARGAGEGMRPPYPPPRGYAHSLAALAPEILERAAVLYVWVTPQESRRRNQERARPGRAGDASILHHGVPEPVMRLDYAGDDIGYLLDHAGRSGSITIPAHGHNFHLPAVRFDNRRDQTSFLRADPGDWPPEAVAGLHGSLRAAFTELDRFRRRHRP